MLKFAIVEDEDSAASKLTECIRRYCKSHDISYDIERFVSAVDFLKNYRPVYDIVFFDIVLPYLNGIDAAKELRNLDDVVTIIFVTNMANLAVRGYEVAALDFVVKPVVYDSFAMKIERAVNAVKRRRRVDVSIPVYRNEKVVSESKIYYIEVTRHNLVYHTDEGDIKARGTLGALEQQLEKENFVRCNSCYLVNMKYVTGVDGDDMIVAGTRLKISRAKKKSVLHTLTNFLGKTV